MIKGYANVRWIQLVAGSVYEGYAKRRRRSREWSHWVLIQCRYFHPNCQALILGGIQHKLSAAHTDECIVCESSGSKSYKNFVLQSMQNTECVLALQFCLDPSQCSLYYNDTPPTGDGTFWILLFLPAVTSPPTPHHHLHHYWCHTICNSMHIIGTLNS